MKNDDPAPVDSAAGLAQAVGAMDSQPRRSNLPARSVTDLIDDIERLSFRRNVVNRPPRRRFAPADEYSIGS